MMVRLEKIRSPLFSNLYKSFLIDDDPMSDEQDWRRVFDYEWNTGEGHCGYALLDDGRVVGMLGMIFSKRCINGTIRKFCNLHTWWVREDHRGRSLSLLRPLLGLDGYTVTHFTPCDKVRAVSKRLGFQDLNSQLTILPPLGPFPTWHRRDEFEVTFDMQIIEQRLSKCEQTLFADHRPYGIGHLLVSGANEQCYVIYTHVKRHRLPYCHIHYVGNKELFASKERAIRTSLLKRHNAMFVAIDARLVQDVRIPFSFNFWAPSHALCKTADVLPEQIDNLYSDVVFLKLTTLPDITHELRQLSRRLLPQPSNHTH